MKKLETVGEHEKFEYEDSKFLQHCTEKIIINFSCNLCNGSFSKEFDNYEKGKVWTECFTPQWLRSCCLVVPLVSLTASQPGRTGVNLTVERDQAFKCFGSHLTRPPLDVEIFIAEEERLDVKRNLTENEEVIHLSGLTPYQDYTIRLRARPSLDLSRTIYSPWLNFTFQTLPDGQLILSRQ